MKVKSLSHVRLLATPWTAAYQAPPSMGFSRQEYWSGVPFPSPIRAPSLHQSRGKDIVSRRPCVLVTGMSFRTGQLTRGTGSVTGTGGRQGGESELRSRG